MDHMEMVEKLREKTGLSYEEAKAALESANWDLLDAMIALEQQGKVKASARYNTRNQTSGEKTNAEPTGEPVQGDTFADVLKKFWGWVCRVCRASVDNELCIVNKAGREFLSIPVLLFVLLLIVGFWVVLPLMIVSLFFGCRYLFRGPNLGKESVNKVVGKATDIAENIKEEFNKEPDAK